MDSRKFTYIDLLKNGHFKKWVLDPDAGTEAYWSKWIEENQDKTEEIKLARHFILNVRYKDNHPLSNTELDRLYDKISNYNNLSVLKQEREKKRKSISGFYWAAAIFLFFACLSILYYANNEIEDALTPLHYNTTSTIKGVKHTLRLPDGTLVKLNSESSLQYPESFSEGTREVYLEGEAFFEVAKDNEKPFIIRTDGFTTEVLGTSFNINSYPDVGYKISVLSGLVRVHAANGSYGYLSPGQMGVFIDKNSPMETLPFNLLKETGWKDGILYFDNEPLADVFHHLERWYGVDIQVSDRKILSDIYKGEFKNESLDNVLNGIGYTSGFNYRIEKKKVLVY